VPETPSFKVNLILLIVSLFTIKSTHLYVWFFSLGADRGMVEQDVDKETASSGDDKPVSEFLAGSILRIKSCLLGPRAWNLR